MSETLRVKSANYIDETTRISFKFNGKKYFGYKGDTLASALLANGIHLVGRSFKYHRPRGILSSGSEEPNALLQIIKDKGTTDPNIRATQIEIFEGLRVESQNCWPNVNFDLDQLVIYCHLLFLLDFIIKPLCGHQIYGKNMNIL